MPNLTLSEIVAIVLVILIVFGPQRLPEIARKAAVLIRHARGTLASLRDEFESEYGEFAEPLKEVRDEVAGVRRDVDHSVAAVTEDIRRIKAEAEAAGGTGSAEGEETDEEAGDAAGGGAAADGLAPS
jgi:sec-independent protein translocase protein TatB